MKNSFLYICFLVFFVVSHSNAQDTMKIKELNEVLIESKRAVPERLQDVEGTNLYSGKKNEVLYLSNIDANLTTNNTRQIFSRVPGVSIWENDGSGTQVSVGTRGLSPNRSWEFNTRQNGYDIASDALGYPEAYYNPPMEAVEKIQIIRGGASLQYGSQFGGLLNYILKKETKNKPFTFQSQNAVGSYGLLSSFNAIGGNTKRISYYVYNHYRKGSGWRENGQYEVRNTYAYFQYKISSNTSISAEYTNMNYEVQQSGGLTDEQYKENNQQSFRKRNWTGIPWNIFAVNFDTKIGDNFTLNFKIFGLSAERNNIGFTATPNIKDTVNTTLKDYNNRQLDRDSYNNVGAELRALYSYRLFNQSHHIAFGARVYQSNINRKQRGLGDTGFGYNTNLMADKYPTELDFKTNNFALFAENQFKITDNFSITPGIRYENIVSDIKGRLTVTNGNDVLVAPASTQRSFFLLGLGLEYKLRSTNFYANLSQAYRPVLYSDLTPPATTDVIDANLKDADGFNFDLGYRGSISNFMSFDVSAFYIQYNNRIGTIRKFIDNDPTKGTYQFRTNLGRSANQGIEAYVDLNIAKALKIDGAIGDITIFGSIAFIKAVYEDFKVTTATGNAPNIILTEENLKNKRVENAPEQIHNIGLTYAYKGFSSTLQTRITTDVYTDAGNTESPNALGTVGKLGGYQVFDLSLEYRFLKNYNVRLSVNNLADLKYTTRRSGGYPGPGILPSEGRTFNLSFGIKI